MAMSLTHTTLFSKTSLFHSRNSLGSLTFCIPFSTSSSSSSAAASSSSLASDKLHRNKWRSPVASVLEPGGVKIGREDVVRDDPTNTVPDTIFSKLGMSLHRRDQHPIGILKNAIYEYFHTSYPN